LKLTSASDQKIAFILDELYRAKSGDVLALSPQEVAEAAAELNDVENARLRYNLISVAMSTDSWRLLETMRNLGRHNVPPPRLVAAWAMSIGADARTIGAIVAEVHGPVGLAREYLKGGRIDVRERQILEDIAAAYGADRSLALAWIKIAVDAEIDGYIDLAHNRAATRGLWQRLCRWIVGDDATALRD